MSIADAFAGIAVAFSNAGLGPFKASIAHWPGVPVYDDGGSILTPGVPIAKSCMCQVDFATQEMRSEAGFVDTDVALLVLVSTLEGPLDTDATIEVKAGPNAGAYSVQSAAKDGMGTHWLCRGRRVAIADDSPLVRLLSGGITGNASLYANLSLGLPISGAVSGTGTVSGAISVASALTGEVSGMGSLTGSVGSGSALAGSIAGGGFVSGAMIVSARLSGVSAGVGTIGGVVSASARLSGAATGSGALAASLSVSTALAGSAGGVGTLAGIVSTRAALSGSVTGSGSTAGTITNAPGTAYGPDAQAYFAAMTMQPAPARKRLIDDLITSGIAKGWWQPLSWFVLLAAHDEQAGRLNAVDPAKALATVNSPLFTADLGFTGDAVSSHLVFGETLGAAGKATANSATIGVWCNQSGGDTVNQSPHFGRAGNQTPQATIRPTGTTGANDTFALNDNANSPFHVSTGNRLGHRTGVRTAGNLKRGYFAGARTVELTVTSVGVANGIMSVLRNDTAYSAARLAAAYAGAELTDAQVAALHDDLNTYLTAIGGQ